MYEIHLEAFDGPLDLLLFFIRRDELDIYDIPIARIADEYLEYVRVMQDVDLDGVGDFLYMAAVLINVKAKLLLPSEELDEEGEPIDPRAELVERLLEYLRYKEATQQLRSLEEQRSLVFHRGAASAVQAEYIDTVEIYQNTTVFDLIKALKPLLLDAPEEPVFELVNESYTVEQQMDFVREVLVVGERHAFRNVVIARSKPFIIATFLAVLEMTRRGLVRLFFNANATDFFIERHVDPLPTEPEVS
ncbi:MAG: segregation/condensation protein A [Rhodothermales bacterium]